MPLESPILDVFISNHTNRRETKKASPNRRYLISFISLLSSLTKEIRHSVDSINLCVHNHISINLSCLTVLMIKQHTTTLLFTLDFVTPLLFLIVKDVYINLIYNTLTCCIEIIA